MEPTIEQIRAAITAHRGGDVEYSNQQLRRIWDATNPAQQVKYLKLAAITKTANAPRAVVTNCTFIDQTTKDAADAACNESESDVHG